MIDKKLLEKLTDYLKEKIGGNFKNISCIYKNTRDELIIFINSNNRDIELPDAIMFIDGSIKFFNHIYIIDNEDKFLVGSKLIYRSRRKKYEIINRIIIENREYLDVFTDHFEFYYSKDCHMYSERKMDIYVPLIKELYEEIYLKTNNTGTAKIVAIINGKASKKLFPKSYYSKVSELLSKYIDDLYIPTFLNPQIKEETK